VNIAGDLRKQRVIEVVPMRGKSDSEAGLVGAMEAEVSESWVKRRLTATKANTKGSMSVKFV
jgi:hypothetical protein